MMSVSLSGRLTGLRSSVNTSYFTHSGCCCCYPRPPPLIALCRPSTMTSALRCCLPCRPVGLRKGGSVAEWLACWAHAQKACVQIAAATLSGNSLRQTAHTYRASVHQAAKLVATLLRVARVTAGLAESNGSLPPGS